MSGRVNGTAGRVRAVCSRLNRGRYPIGSRRELTRKELKERAFDLAYARNEKFLRTKEQFVKTQLQMAEYRKRRSLSLQAHA